MSNSNDNDELLEEIEDALEMDESVPVAIPTTDSFPDLPTDLLEQFFKHTYLMDRIRLDMVWPHRLNRFTHIYFRENIGKFSIAPDSFLKYTGRTEIEEKQFVDDLLFMMPVLGKYITNLTVNYSTFLEWPSVPAIVSTLVKKYCHSLIKLHINGISNFAFDPKVMARPDMSVIESFVYIDFERRHNQDNFIKAYLEECSNSLESLTINYTFLDGSCLLTLKNLRFLQMHLNRTVVEVVIEDGSKSIKPIELTIGSLATYCEVSTVRHLEIKQHVLNEKDVAALLSMEHLTYLVLKIIRPNQCMNLLVQRFAEKDNLYHLELSGYGQPDYELSEKTLRMLSVCKRLRRLSLGGVAQTEPLLRVMQGLSDRMVKVNYYKNHSDEEEDISL